MMTFSIEYGKIMKNSMVPSHQPVVTSLTAFTETEKHEKTPDKGLRARSKLSYLECGNHCIRGKSSNLTHQVRKRDLTSKLTVISIERNGHIQQLIWRCSQLTGSYDI